MEERIESAPCERGNDLVSFLYEELDREALREFQQHLRSCSSCSDDLGSFQKVRAGVVAWRQASLGLSVFPAGANATFKHDKASALTAIRQFFALSPVWLKGAVALASILFFVALGTLVMKPRTTSETPLVQSDKVYSEAEMRAKVEASVEERMRELRAVNKDSVNDKPAELILTRGTAPKAKSSLSAKTRRAPLTRSEREQLAADLRLISTTDDSDLDLLGEHINNR
jgi:hypothetical protein